MRVLAGLLALLCAVPAAAGAPLRLAWQPAGGAAQAWTLDARPARPDTASPLDPQLTTPLGSTWKLFVYAWLVDHDVTPPDYRCGELPATLSAAERAARLADERYCCTPGGTIDREHALVASCGAYFAPARLGLDAAAWRAYWTRLGAPDWLRALDQLHAARRVPVAELLRALAVIPAPAREASAHTLVSVLTLGRAEGSVGLLGSLLRVKTWTMPDPARPGASLGGGAGWLADGTPVWLGGSGGSGAVLRRAAPALQPLLATLRVPDDGGCVRVDYFARYPIAAVLPATGTAAVADGVLDGAYRVHFANGQWLAIESRGELALAHVDGQPRIEGRLGLNDYVARVIAREGGSAEPAAAAALAVAARSYLLQQATRTRGCWRIADASRTQRVAPRPPDAGARAAADLTDSLVLQGVTVQYHGERADAGRMSWQTAVALARGGATFDAILAHTWPEATLTSFRSPLGDDCVPLDAARRWLAAEAPRWQRLLAGEPGFEPPARIAVCRLKAGRPFADTRRQRIHVAGLRLAEDRLALAHEYLHLAFARHPRGQDERFIEARARALLALPSALPQGSHP